MANAISTGRVADAPRTLPRPVQLGLQSVDPQEISKVQSTFEYYDADGNGCMDGPEFAKMAAELVRPHRCVIPYPPARPNLTYLLTAHDVGRSH